MSCKTYSQIMEEIRPYLKGESAADVDAAIKAASAASHEDLVDAYESNREDERVNECKLHPR